MIFKLKSINFLLERSKVMRKILKIHKTTQFIGFTKTMFILIIKSMFFLIVLLNSSPILIHKNSSILLAKDKSEKTYNLKIEGMTCTGCESAIKKSVKKLNGVKDVQADYKTGEGTVKFDKNKVNIDDIIQSIEKLGYKVVKFEEL